MPAIFYREAIQAGVGEKPLDGFGDEHFTNCENLAVAKDRGRPEPVDLTKHICPGGIAQARRHNRLSFHH